MRQDFSLQGKRMIVTGAASGMGREFVRLAAGDGANLAILDINAAGLQETTGLVDASRIAFQGQVDLTVWEQVESVVNDAVLALGGLDVLVNVAGWDAPGVFWEQPMDLWHKLIGINLWGPLHMCRATIPALMANEGGSRIVLVSSDAGRVGSKGETVYAAAKGGSIALTKSLARELAPHQIGVNVLCPGPTQTPLFEEEARENPKLMERLVRSVPLRRIGQPQDMANALAFLASDAASYMTGQVLSVSGGLTMVG